MRDAAPIISAVVSAVALANCSLSVWSFPVLSVTVQVSSGSNTAWVVISLRLTSYVPERLVVTKINVCVKAGHIGRHIYLLRSVHPSATLSTHRYRYCM